MILSHWQKVKLKHKTGKRKQELEEHFGIATHKISDKEYRDSLKDVVTLNDESSEKQRKSKKKSKKSYEQGE